MAARRTVALLLLPSRQVMAGKKGGLQLQLQQRTHKGQPRPSLTRVAPRTGPSRRKEAHHSRTPARRIPDPARSKIKSSLLLPARGACALGNAQWAMGNWALSTLATTARWLARLGLGLAAVHTRNGLAPCIRIASSSSGTAHSGRDGRGADGECTVRPRRSMTSLAAGGGLIWHHLRRCHPHAHRLSRRSRGEAADGWMARQRLENDSLPPHFWF